MISAPPLKTAALLILQQANETPKPGEQKTGGGADIVATANGVPTSAISGADGQSGRAEGKVAEAYFGANSVNTNALKINLMERLGAELGVNIDDFDTHAEYGAAIREVIGQIRIQDGGSLRLAALERELGLHKLGISLDELVGAIIDSDGEDAAKLEAALRKELGELEGEGEKGADSDAVLARLQLDENGLYTI